MFSSKQISASLWADTAPSRQAAPAVAGRIDTDVAVIGGGFSGLSTALHLARAGHQVTVLEGMEVGFGGSGRNNGQVIPTMTAAEPDAIETRFGEAGERFVALVRDSASYLFDTVREEGIDCEGEQTGWFQPAHRESRLKLSRARVDAWAKRGAPARLVEAAECAELLGSDRWFGGMYNPTGGHINPLALARGLASACEAKGVAIREKSPVEAVERRDGRWHLRTPTGEVVARAVMLASNAYTGFLSSELAPKVARSVVPVLSWQMATRPLTDDQRKVVVPGRQAVSDTHGDLHFFRYDKRNRLVTGGALALGHNGPDRLREIVGRRLQAAFPVLGKPEFDFVWNGYIGMTEDRFPFICQLGPDFWCWAGCNGRGVALSVSLGREFAAAIAGTPVSQLALPMSDPKPIPMHGLVKTFAPPAMLQLYRWRDGRD
ncbi:NAD(P)/FAD-dependent oxidoreductase [Stappia indica]|uniref:NAD(P)/FAD-dependent oxidoreductase n=1 Tax=Stappia indica TaxID=538381 RepID=UPI00082AA905|nr:FAD-dependent oxidoreductase [Stappia indica]